MPITITLRPELNTEAQTELFKSGIVSTMRQTNTKTELYEYINNELIARKYQLQTKKEKTIIKKFLISITGYKEKQIDSFIKIYKSGKKIKRKKRTEYYFEKKYKQEDIALLLELHDMSKGICGQVVQVLCHDMYILYGDPRYEKVSMISSSHFYRIKNTHFWKERSLVYEHTKANKVAIGERTRPQNEGKPGFLRIDTVHQGSTTKGDGLYHINVVDEVTQYEFNAAVPYINEFYMEPLLIKLIDLFPFKIMNFHSDNGSEYINVMVNELLTKLFIKQTKSRPRKSTDNGLIETKNAQVIRKFIPRGFISK